MLHVLCEGLTVTDAADNMQVVVAVDEMLRETWPLLLRERVRGGFTDNVILSRCENSTDNARLLDVVCTSLNCVLVFDDMVVDSVAVHVIDNVELLINDNVTVFVHVPSIECEAVFTPTDELSLESEACDTLIVRSTDIDLGVTDTYRDGVSNEDRVGCDCETLLVMVMTLPTVLVCSLFCVTVQLDVLMLVRVLDGTCDGVGGGVMVLVNVALSVTVNSSDPLTLLEVVVLLTSVFDSPLSLVVPLPEGTRVSSCVADSVTVMFVVVSVQSGDASSLELL